MRRALVIPIALVMAVAVTSCSAPDDPGEDASGHPASDESAASRDALATGDPTGLRTALVELGVDVRSAPPRAVNAPHDEFCGIEDATRRAVDEEARRCFLDAHMARLGASFVSVQTTDEGDPIVTVWRARGDGRVEQFTDSTRDSFGSGTWSTLTCSRLAIGSREEPTAFSCERGRTYGSFRVRGAAPGWFSDRVVVPLCGYADGTADEDIRRCFFDAFNAGDPAELAYVSVGDEGESSARWFRINGDGDYEVLERQLPSEAWPSSGTWQRHVCTTFVFLDEPGYEVDQLPQLNWEGECSVVETE